MPRLSGAALYAAIIEAYGEEEIVAAMRRRASDTRDRSSRPGLSILARALIELQDVPQNSQGEGVGGFSEQTLRLLRAAAIIPQRRRTEEDEQPDTEPADEEPESEDETEVSADTLENTLSEPENRLPA